MQDGVKETMSSGKYVNRNKTGRFFISVYFIVIVIFCSSLH